MPGARLEYPAADDPMQVASTELATAIAALILANTDSVNVATTALARVLSSVMTFVEDADVEPALACVCESVRINRAVATAPAKSEMN